MDGQKLDRMLQGFYGEVQIEDLWLNYFCISSNIGKGQKVIHRTGPLWKAIRATIAIPGIFPPFIENGQLLTDGSSVEVNPTITMAQFNPGPIILADISVNPLQDISICHEDLPSPIQLFWQRINPWCKSTHKVPQLTDILSMALKIQSVQNYERSLAAADLVLSFSLENCDFRSFNRIEQIFEISYNDTLPKLETWLAATQNARPSPS